MKVTTDLKAGNFVDEAAQTVNDLSAQVGIFFGAAEQQAETLVTNIGNATGSAWQKLVEYF